MCSSIAGLQHRLDQRPCFAQQLELPFIQTIGEQPWRKFRRKFARSRSHGIYAARTRPKKRATFVFQIMRPGGQACGPAAHLLDGFRTLPGGLFHRLDFGRTTSGVARRLLDAVGDITRGRALLLDRRSDRGGNFGQLMDAARDGGDLVDRALGRVLDGSHVARNVFGCARGLIGERLHLCGNHREALAGLSRARCLDGGVERKQVGLGGDLGNEPDHRADPFRRLIKRADGLVGAFGVGNRGARHVETARGLLADLLN